MNIRRMSLLAGLAGMLAGSGLTAQTAPSVSPQPSRVFSYNPNQEPAAEQEDLRLPGSATSERVLRLKTESESSYAIPANQESFTGILFYRPQPLELPETEPVYYVPTLVRIMVDGKTLIEQTMDGTTPPIEFSVPVGGASNLTIASLARFVGGAFYLAQGRFRPVKTDTFTRYLPSTGEGYVDCSPLPRQGILGIYHPGETVAVHAYFAGAATEADVTLRLTPEQRGQPPSRAQFTIPLKEVRAGLVQGVTNWKIPVSLGPARLEVEERVGGQTVFTRVFRIAAGPEINLAELPDNNFGVHLSTTGYPLLYDSFAGLWGAKWGRLYLKWSVVEAVRGQYDFSRMDQLLNVYRAQDMRILAVLGEDAPAWAGLPGPDYYYAWKRFVAAIAQHLAGRVDAWDVFNEVDVKYNGSLSKGVAADWDITVLRTALDTLRAADPRGKMVCCSTGTTLWLPYDKKLFDASLLDQIDNVSLHPYQPGAPEERDGPFNYLERVDALKSLVRSYGLDKPIWSTEANWILGSHGATDVPDLDVTELEQAEYAVRVNLLSLAAGVKYFLHSPFSHRYRPQPHLATWAAYAEMASLFSRATHATLLVAGPRVFGITASTTNGRVGALWSTEHEATVRLTGGGYRFMDLYGNPVTVDPGALHLSPAPLYFEGGISTPEVQVLDDAPAPRWRSTPQIALWPCVKGTRCTSIPKGRRVESQPSKYGYQLVSPPFTVEAGSCERVRFQLMLEKGALGFFALDATTGKRIGRTAYSSSLPDNRSRMIEFRFRTPPSTSSVKLVIANGNLDEVQSIFTALDPQVAECR